MSAVISTSAEPSSSVRSVALVSAARIASDLSTVSAARLTARLTVSAPQAVVARSAVTEIPTQAAVCRSFICPTPKIHAVTDMCANCEPRSIHTH